MTCYSAEHLGGQAFCAETCDPELGSPDPDHFACVGSGALLRTCSPNMQQGCPDGLSCYRTSLHPLEDKGLCLPMTVCSSKADCAASGARSSCVGDLVKEKFPKATILTDNLHCVQLCHDLGETGPACPKTEACLTDLYPFPSTPNICVQFCSDQSPCPPNFSCVADIGPSYPAVCVPGFPGARCTREEDCALGDCRDTGSGFSICTLDCDPNHDSCWLLDGPRGPSFCAGSMCVIKSPFAGVNCTTDAECSSDEECSDLDPYDPSVPRARGVSAECHRLCDGPGQCNPDSIVPYVCLKDRGHYGECYPADFGLPCEPGVERCMGKLTCMSSTGIPGSNSDPELAPSMGGQPICTIPCTGDADCTQYNLTQNGSCEFGICQLRQKDEDCSNSSQCFSRRCGTNGTCE